jgi:hypothetical protein
MYILPVMIWIENKHTLQKFIFVFRGMPLWLLWLSITIFFLLLISFYSTYLELIHSFIYATKLDTYEEFT